MDETKNSPCKGCNSGAVEAQLHAEVENLRQNVAEKDAHIVGLEAEFVKCTARADDLEEQVDTWREKYERLYDSHKRVQKLNQVLEDKLLQMVDKMKSEKSQLTKDIATLSVRLAESKHNYGMLQKENERYKNDMNLAIQLLQCKPDNFVSQKLDNLPVDTQARVSQYVMSKTSKPCSSSQSKNGNDLDTFDTSEYEFNISASLMSKILEDSIQDTLTKHCDTCTCTKSQSKPFCYNESYYSVSTQTLLSGEMKNSLCLNCNSEIKSIKSNLSLRSPSPHSIKLINEKTNLALGNVYLLPQPDSVVVGNNHKTEKNVHNDVIEVDCTNDNIKVTCSLENDSVSKIEQELKLSKKSNNDTMNMEPSVHHKLCDRTKASISSNKSSINSVGNSDLLFKDKTIDKDLKVSNQLQSAETTSLRKNSQSSMGAGSRTSSIAKSTVSTHKSNTQVGPGPRFCHLRMQAGSKNILLDNAEPDVPPVLYRRQSKCNDNSIFKDLNDGMDNFVDLVKTEDDYKSGENTESVVVETTLIDVHVDNNNKDSESSIKTNSINPILLNVSSSPLQPLKTHNFSNSSEHRNNNAQSISSLQNHSEIDNLLNDFNIDNSVQKNAESVVGKPNNLATSNDQEVKIFNFDRYEQNKTNHFTRPLKKIDMSQLHSIENTKISKDYPPIGNLPNFDNKVDANLKQQKSSLPAIVNVYPNLTQTHLKVNESTKVFTNEQSTSSLSSDDSAAILQKQQLLRVAEWVEKNLEQQNNFNDPLEDECNFVNRNLRRDNKLSRLTETLNELALNMPHPVSKFSKSYARDSHNSWIHKNFTHQNTNQDKDIKASKVTGNIVKETIFPVESGDVTVTEINVDNSKINISRENEPNYNMESELVDALKSKSDKEISPEDLARMEYNVKKFLLSGPHWANPATAVRSRRTSSKTETDV